MPRHAGLRWLALVGCASARPQPLDSAVNSALSAELSAAPVSITTHAMAEGPSEADAARARAVVEAAERALREYDYE